VSSGRFEVGPSISYNSGFYWGPDDRLRQPNRTLINGAVTWQSSDDLWTARLWGKNLTGAHYYLLENDRPNGDYVRPAAPLTFGLSLSRRFE
jgi:iron complex outermembrane receptor protein